jgi:hypothetical protein
MLIIAHIAEPRRLIAGDGGAPSFQEWLRRLEKSFHPGRPAGSWALFLVLTDERWRQPERPLVSKCALFFEGLSASMF